MKTLLSQGGVVGKIDEEYRIARISRCRAASRRERGECASPALLKMISSSINNGYKAHQNGVRDDLARTFRPMFVHSL